MFCKKIIYVNKKALLFGSAFLFMSQETTKVYSIHLHGCISSFRLPDVPKERSSCSRNTFYYQRNVRSGRLVGSTINFPRVIRSIGTFGRFLTFYECLNCIHSHTQNVYFWRKMKL